MSRLVPEEKVVFHMNWMHHFHICMLGLIGSFLLANPISATTTAGTTRNVNIDGVVTLGAPAGNNGPNWETDEVFEGFQSSGGSVDWYLTWDNNNLYLGRIGGSNIEGSVIYLRADFPGSTNTNRAFDYDSLNPEVSLMGGINFAAYFKSGYDEFRIWTGGPLWSAADISLVPIFTNQSGTNHMEVVIPWGAITGEMAVQPISERLSTKSLRLPELPHAPLPDILSTVSHLGVLVTREMAPISE